MLHLDRLLAAKPQALEDCALMPLLTPWGESFNTSSVLPEHPRPQAERANWKSLNGPWRYMITEGAPADPRSCEALSRATFPSAFAEESASIVVPFSPEALLSGVDRQLQPHEILWYARTFSSLCKNPDDRLILHFDAVDFACAVWVNDSLVGTHRGAYDAFSLDVTECVIAGSNSLRVAVCDPSDTCTQLRGKQKLARGNIWYTAQSGIWQSVWLECVPATYVKNFTLSPDLDSATLTVRAELSAASADPMEVLVFDASGALVASGTAVTQEPTCNRLVRLAIPNVSAWSPDDPVLYTVELRCGRDKVKSYCGFRTVSLQADDTGHKRVFLNGKPIFLKGVLDQGYWPDGLMTAPSDEALVHDIVAMRNAGFNMLRKHIKVESARWYYHCDRLGMLVWQDMVNGGAAADDFTAAHVWHTSYKPSLFRFSWGAYDDTKPNHIKNLLAQDPAFQRDWEEGMRLVIGQLSHHPSIITWVLFNEGWGQFRACEMTKIARELDSTRLIDSTSGWYDQGCGDFVSVHNYFRDMRVWPDPKRERAFVVSEFGGLSFACEGHASVPEAYGYGTAGDISAWAKDVRKLLLEMESLEPRGLAGYVYTQLSDVEEEMNGLLTYDRRVSKLFS